MSLSRMRQILRGSPEDHLFPRDYRFDAMELRTINSISPEARTIFDTFKAKEASQHLANLVAIEAVLQTVRQLKPRKVLEIGAGIGTLTYLILRYTDAELVAVEHNDFCRQAMRKNLAGLRSYKVCNYDDIAPQEYDLVIVDGGSGEHPDGGAPGFTRYALSGGAKVVFVEHNRFEQRREAREAMSEYCRYRTVRYAGREGKGGYQIEAVSRGSFLSRPLWHFYYEHLDFPIYRVTRKLKTILGPSP
jgi:protein-L-isoaspartate O-methyltransferase